MIIGTQLSVGLDTTILTLDNEKKEPRCGSGH